MISRIRFALLFLLLGGFGVAFAGSAANEMSPAEQAADDQAYTIINNRSHAFYVNVGVNYFNMDLPDFTFPWSVGSDGLNTSVSSTSSSGIDLDNRVSTVKPSFGIGYTFYNDDQLLRKLFGEVSSVEFRYSYVHDSDSGLDDNLGLYGDGWYITGSNSSGESSLQDGNSYALVNNDYSYDDTIQTMGLYFIGDKAINSSIKHAPYIGLDLILLDQDDDYTMQFADQPYTPGDSLNTQTGSDDLSTYYFGVSVGDTFTRYLGEKFDVFSEVGLSVYDSHSELDAKQTPIASSPGPIYNSTYKLDTTDDKITFRGKLGIGSSYYFYGNQNPQSPRLTLSGGVEYWNDVPYADNPTGEGEVVKISYDRSTSYYTGLDLLYPFD